MKRTLQLIECKICGLSTKSNGLATHLKHKHNLTTTDYVFKYGEFRPKYLNYKNRSDKSNFICKICHTHFASERHLTYHIRINHSMSKEDYIMSIILNGVIPKCKCGCGNDVKILKKGSLYFREYLSGHNAAFNHTGTFRTDESKMRMRKSAIERIKNKKGVFFQSATSKAELELLDWIQSIYSDEIEHKNITLLHGHEIDIFIPKLNLAIELNGERFHSDLYKKKSYHLKKTKECNNIGVRLIHIWLSDWISKREIIQSQLKSILNFNDDKIYARKCQIKPVSNHTCLEFLNKNHLQGTSISKHRYGLFYNNELVQIMTFGKMRNLTGRTHTNNHYELVRMCTKLNTVVIGGASKLYKFFIKEHNPSYIISFANRDWSLGNVYEKIGMSKSGYTSPGYFYSKGKQKYHRYKFQKHKLVKLGYDKTKTEYEIMLDLGYYRVWNCGNIIYEWNK